MTQTPREILNKEVKVFFSVETISIVLIINALIIIRAKFLRVEIKTVVTSTRK